MSWQPTRILRVDRVLDTSMRTAEVVTDAGTAYVKALGSNEGPHALAAELVGSRAARWLGLETLTFAILDLGQDDVVAYPEEGAPMTGPAFATSAVEGHTWGGASEELEAVENIDAIAGLVVHDTWTLNCDRYRAPAPGAFKKPRSNPRNVFFSGGSASKGWLRLLAIDHTHCFTCGHGPTKALGAISTIRSEQVLGLFPGFVPFVTRERVRPFLDRLRQFSNADAAAITSDIPRQWGYGAEVVVGLMDLLVQRARFVAMNLPKLLEPLCEWDPVLDSVEDGNG